MKSLLFISIGLLLNIKDGVLYLNKTPSLIDSFFILLLFFIIIEVFPWPGFEPASHGKTQDQDQRSEPEAESQVQSTSDDVLHAVSITAYETHRWKEDSCSPNLDGDWAQGANKI